MKGLVVVLYQEVDVSIGAGDHLLLNSNRGGYTVEECSNNVAVLSGIAGRLGDSNQFHVDTFLGIVWDVFGECFASLLTCQENVEQHTIIGNHVTVIEFHPNCPRSVNLGSVAA